MKIVKILSAVGFLVAVVLVIRVSLHSRVQDTPHKLHGTNGIVVPNQEICRPCHTPHNASSEVPYIWNHELTTAVYTIHDGADLASIQSGASRLCLSCHDGTVALDAFGGLPGSVFISGDKEIGTDLTLHHPIGVDYPTDPAAYNQPDGNGDVVDPVETPAGQAAQLENGKVQCSSCHMAHGSNAPFGQFLRVDNTGSALCMTCHLDPG